MCRTIIGVRSTRFFSEAREDYSSRRRSRPTVLAARVPSKTFDLADENDVKIRKSSQSDHTSSGTTEPFPPTPKLSWARRWKLNPNCSRAVLRDRVMHALRRFAPACAEYQRNQPEVVLLSISTQKLEACVESSCTAFAIPAARSLPSPWKSRNQFRAHVQQFGASNPAVRRWKSGNQFSQSVRSRSAIRTVRRILPHGRCRTWIRLQLWSTLP